MEKKNWANGAISSAPYLTTFLDIFRKARGVRPHPTRLQGGLSNILI